MIDFQIVSKAGQSVQKAGPFSKFGRPTTSATQPANGDVRHPTAAEALAATQRIEPNAQATSVKGIMAAQRALAREAKQ